MPHDYKTKTVDYNEEKPPDWYTSEERINYYPARDAWFVCREIDRVEALFAEKAAKEETQLTNGGNKNE